MSGATCGQWGVWGSASSVDAVRIMKDMYGIDMELTQYSKLLSEIPPVDIVITMGCNVDSASSL